MANYQNILLVVDLSEDSEIIGERARAIAARNGSAITLLHVVEYVPVEPMGEALLPTMQIEADLIDRARTQLTELAGKLGMAERPQRIEVGGIKSEIIRVANEIAADLIVLGSRERHGLAILLNFTEDAVLHSAPCDVLAVRLR